MDALPETIQEELQFIETILRKSGQLARERFGTIHHFSTKDDPNQVVTEVDVQSEALLIDAITAKYPHDSIIAEESGFVQKESNETWIIDPIDGSSNYANGLPWYGVMVARLTDFVPHVAGIYLPATDEMFLAAKTYGAYYNGMRIKRKQQLLLMHALVSFCVDHTTDQKKLAQFSATYQRIVGSVRNVRATNSAVDYAYAAAGKLDAGVNLVNKIWDVAAGILIAQEAGARVSAINGELINLRVDQATYMKNFTLVISHPAILHDLLLLLHDAE